MQTINPKTKNKKQPASKAKKVQVILWTTISLAIFALIANIAGPRYFSKTETPSTENNNASPAKITQSKPKNNESKFYSNLDGTETTKDKVNARPLAVVIENHPQARPQAGFLEASHIWEYVTEGGITRFLAVYGPELPAKVGPIRSARTFSVSWAAGYKALFAHAGGSQGGLNLIAQLGSIVDLPHSGSYFYREPAPGIASEHTLFSDGERLMNFAKNKGASLTGDFTPYKFKKEAKKEVDRPAANSVTINFSTPGYKVNWTYNPKDNLYYREMANVKHVDRATKKQLSSANIVILTVSRNYNPNTNGGKGEWFMTTEGQGTAKVYSEGKLTVGTWSKASKDKMVLLKDSDGKDIELLPGQTWFEVIPPEAGVTYTGN